MAAGWISTDQFVWSVERLLDGITRPGRAGQPAVGSSVSDTPLMQYRSLVGVG